ncbi:conserved hypothetical protein [Beggiatoa sp. PS]|nr:conserved hypothetical protein [Beggiatoa sp. PS]
MKLIIREYLASLRERKELDVLLPNLLSQMGLDVFSKPSIGNRQYGVDVAAYGSIDNQPKKVYLFSVKSGDLGRKDWNSGLLQDLQPSLDEIRETYIPTHLPAEYKSKPIEICICFGGNLKEEVRLNVSTYEQKYSTKQLSFSEWGGEKLSTYIEKFLLREELLPDKCHRLLRKSLAMLDEPNVSYNHFRQIVILLSASETQKPKKAKEETLTAIRQLYLCLWILYAWCREADNLESAFLASELTLLNAWFMRKPYLKKKDKDSKAIQRTFNSILLLNKQINDDYLETKILPHTDKLYALSSAVVPSCAVDVNLKLFDILGRLALSGLWTYWYLNQIPDTDENTDSIQDFRQKIEQHQVAIKQLITNNPMLFAPYKDDQAIDITFAVWFLALDTKNHGYLYAWLIRMIHQIQFLFQTNSKYPCNLRNYHELLEHPVQEIETYREDVTQGSILYPVISVFSALLEFNDVYEGVKNIKSEHLPHCNFQVWYPDETSEEHYYKNDALHGATLSHVGIDKEQKIFLYELFKECDESAHFNELSAVKYNHWPIILLACRHYRLPIPPHFFSSLKQHPSNSENHDVGCEDSL